MKLKLLIIASVAILTAACSSEGPDMSDEVRKIEMTPAVSRAAEQSSQFKYTILEGANKVEPKNENIVISPLTLSMGLTVFANHINEGNAETSAYNSENLKRLLNVLGTNDLESLDTLATSYVDAIPNLEKDTKCDLSNLLYRKISNFRSGDVPDWYVDICRTDSALFYDILRADVVYGYTKSNGDVAIDDKYKEFFGKNNFDYVNDVFSDIGFMLFSNLDFNGQWTDKFNKADTRKTVFRGKDESVLVDMMNQEKMFKVAYNDKMSALKKTFGNGAFEFVAVLPDEGIDIDDIINSGELQKLEELDFYESNIQLGLPKFNISTGLKDNGVWLQAVGIATTGKHLLDPGNHPDAYFGFEGNFSSEITLKLDEDGAKVEAVSTYSEGLIAPAPPTSFICDRPFVMMINITQTGTSIVIAKIVSMKK